MDGRAHPLRGWAFLQPAIPVILVLLLGLIGLPSSVRADPAYEGPLLYGLDPVIRTTEDRRLLGIDRIVLLQRLADQGIRPMRDSGARPDLKSALRRHWLERANVDLERTEQLVEINGLLGVMTIIEYPSFLFLFPAREILPGGYSYFPPRPLDDPDVDLFVDDLDTAIARAHGVIQRTGRFGILDRAGGGRRTDADDGLINLTIPVKLPKTLEKIIGRGEKTNIRISGRSRIALTGESSVTNPFLGNERVQSQSLFPTLDMEQELQVSLSGNIGEKIIIAVDHNSAAIGPEATKIKLMYQGDEDELIHTIESGDVGLTLPNSQLLGYNSNKSGLFGLKVTGQMGPAEFTVVASKQKAESTSQTFSSTGGQITEHEILSGSFIRNRFFRLTSDFEENRIPMAAIVTQSIRVYQKVATTGDIQPGELENVAAYRDSSGLWDPDTLRTPDVYGSRWRPLTIGTDPFEPRDFSLMVDESGALWGIDLRMNVGDNAELAVTYEYRISETETRLVGDDLNKERRSTIVTEGGVHEGLWYRLKLLKAATSSRNEWAHNLMIRQIYSLGGANISPESFNLRIERLDASTDQPRYDENGVNYLRIFGLDNGDIYGEGAPDERPDIQRGQLFDLQRGLLIYPENFPTPFDTSQAAYEANAQTEIAWGTLPDGGEAFLSRNQAPKLYELGSTQTDFSEASYFRFVAEHSSASNIISLNASNIEEGSVVVKVDGQTLTQGQDYDIDLVFGEITLKEGSFTLTAESKIAVTYSYSPFVGGGNTSLMGAHVKYELGRESTVSSTVLYETENIVGEKAKLGEEPSKNLVGNINFGHNMRPGFLTGVANLLSRRNTERESSLKFAGEIAASVPNANTMGDVYLEDFEGVDASNMISLVRTAWTLPGLPAAGADGSSATAPNYEDRVGTIRWFMPEQRVLRRYLNPDLVNQERDETQPAMDLYLRANGGWQPDSWGGIMRGVSATGLDLQRSQFVEIWLNDKQPDPLLRSGRLHIDFGLISEDGYWPDDAAGEPEHKTQQDEDADHDKIFKIEEDTGLGGITDDKDFDPTYGSAADPYPDINSTKGNNSWDLEDANRNGSFELSDQYFSTIIDLRDTEALVDVLEDYNDVADLRAEGHSWRKYRIPLSEIQSITGTGFEPELDRIKHVRIWFEDETRSDEVIWLQLSELRFVGSRWERQGIRDVAGENVLEPADLPAGDAFFLGEVNNKENPDYQPPYPVRVENGIPEREQSLVIDFQHLDRGHMLRTGKQVSSQGDDYLAYTELNWWWYNPDHRTADMDLFFRVGADSLNFYEVRYRFAEGREKTGWKGINVNLVDLSNVKNGAVDPDGNRVGLVRDSRSSDEYDVRVVGRPDLRRVKRYYALVANNAVSEPVSGFVYLNDVRLLGVKRDKGFAERAGVSMNMADVFRLDFDWRHQDSEFHGLDKTRGSGVDNVDWTLGMSFTVDDFVPLLGFKLPVSFNRRKMTQRPKYELNSDIEIRDEEVRAGLSTLDQNESFSARLSHPGSQSALLRYVVDPWVFSLNGNQSGKISPLVETQGKTLSGGVNYDLRIPGRTTLRGLPLVGGIPVVGALSILPSHVGVTSNFTNKYSSNVTINDDGSRTPRPEIRNKPLDITASVDYQPLSVLGIGASGVSKRDMMREQEVAGINIGEENLRNYSLSLNFSVPRAKELPAGAIFKPVRTLVRGLNEMRPSVRFNGGSADDHNPSLVQEGDPPDIHSVRNSGNWDFQLSLPLGDLAKKYFPGKRYDSAERERLLREQQRVQDQAARRGQDSLSVQLTDAEIEGLSPDQINELRETRMLEAAEVRRQQEEEVARDRAPAETGGRLPIPNPLKLVAATFRNMQPVKFTFTDKRNSAYARLVGSTPFWYRTGLGSILDVPDSLYAASSETDQQVVSISVTTKLHRNASMDVKFNETNSRRDQTGTLTRGYQKDWPDGQVSLSGLERWPIFGGGNRGADEGWFKTSNLTVSYRRSKIVNNITENFYNPRTNTILNPRWTATFHSGLTATASLNQTNEETVNLGSTQRNSGTRMGLQLRHQFRAQAFLARMGLYRPGSNPTITMDVDISYQQNRSVRIDADGTEGTTTGNNRFNLGPRFSYNITRNLTGTARIIFGRTSNIQTGQTTTNLGLGLEATFVF